MSNVVKFDRTPRHDKDQAHATDYVIDLEAKHQPLHLSTMTVAQAFIAGMNYRDDLSTNKIMFNNIAMQEIVRGGDRGVEVHKT